MIVMLTLQTSCYSDGESSGVTKPDVFGKEPDDHEVKGLQI